MKSVLIFLVLIVIVVCPFPEYDREERRRKKNEFRKEIADCILESSKISSELRKQIEDNKDDDLRKVLHLYITKLDSNDREIIRKCRRELFGKMREMHRGRFHGGIGGLNLTRPQPYFHERHGNNQP